MKEPILILFSRPGCWYSTEVAIALKKLNLEFEERDIANRDHARELELRGGEVRVPYLVDETNGVELYESADIIEYLNVMYGEGATSET